MADKVKISDSTSTTSSIIAASCTAVKAAMDKANSAAVAASNAQTTANSKLSSIAAGTGISVSGNKVGLASVVTAGTIGGNSNSTLNFGSTFTTPYVTYDAYGRVTGGGTRTLTMPSAPSGGTASTLSSVAVANKSDSDAEAIGYGGMTVTSGTKSTFKLPSGGTWRWVGIVGMMSYGGQSSGGTNIITNASYGFAIAIRIS